jgi:2-polyprenyl-3-methyl-5-hydroxy-6-metoxy-1,4-benzoquinol methylase
MKLIQNNKDNITGFSVVEGTDFGVDEDNKKAMGYQHHDALWWGGVDKVEASRPKTMDFDQTMNWFKSMFAYVARQTLDVYNPDSLLELGCGSGLMSRIFKRYKPDMVVATVDANQVVKEKSPYVGENHFLARSDKKLDITDEDGKRKFFDVVISLEHFEHIPPETCDTMMENIRDHTQPGAHLIFTAAEWEYEDDQNHIHCNAQTEEYWQDYVVKFGFEVIENPFTIGRAGDTWEVFARRV